MNADRGVIGSQQLRWDGVLVPERRRTATNAEHAGEPACQRGSRGSGAATSDQRRSFNGFTPVSTTSPVAEMRTSATGVASTSDTE